MGKAVKKNGQIWEAGVGPGLSIALLYPVALASLCSKLGRANRELGASLSSGIAEPQGLLL